METAKSKEKFVSNINHPHFLQENPIHQRLRKNVEN